MTPPHAIEDTTAAEPTRERRLNPFPGEVDDAHAAATEFFYQFVPGWGQADLRPQAFRDHRRADLEFRPLDRFARGARRFGRRRRH